MKVAFKLFKCSFDTFDTFDLRYQAKALFSIKTVSFLRAEDAPSLPRASQLANNLVTHSYWTRTIRITSNNNRNKVHLPWSPFVWTDGCAWASTTTWFVCSCLRQAFGSIHSPRIRTRKTHGAHCGRIPGPPSRQTWAFQRTSQNSPHIQAQPIKNHHISHSFITWYCRFSRDATKNGWMTLFNIHWATFRNPWSAATSGRLETGRLCHQQNAFYLRGGPWPHYMSSFRSGLWASRSAKRPGDSNGAAARRTSTTHHQLSAASHV